ncbi:MAG: hypothetical protein ABIR63_03830 [Sphingomicrobium sp.]
MPAAADAAFAFTFGPLTRRRRARYIVDIIGEQDARLDWSGCGVQYRAVRYFLDTEYNGWGGALISLALVPEGGEELYLTLALDDPLEPWVERHVLPYLDMVPAGLVSPRLKRIDAALMLSHYLAPDPEPLIVADWPEDIAQIAMLLITGNGEMVACPRLRFEMLRLPGFSTAATSKVAHNALHDARALRDHVLGLE